MFSVYGKTNKNQSYVNLVNTSMNSWLGAYVLALTAEKAIINDNPVSSNTSSSYRFQPLNIKYNFLLKKTTQKFLREMAGFRPGQEMSKMNL